MCRTIQLMMSVRCKRKSANMTFLQWQKEELGLIRHGLALAPIPFKFYSLSCLLVAEYSWS